MSRFIPLHICLAAPVILLAQSAFADLTPAEVWGDWRQYMEGMGYQVSASESASGSDLTVSDINLNYTMPETAGAMSMTLGTIAFNQIGDGTVAIVMPEVLPMNITGINTETGESFTLSMRYTQTGHQMTASGSAQKMTYGYTAGTFGLVLDQLQVGADTYGEENAKLVVAGTKISGETTMTIGDVRSYDQTAQIDTLTYDVLINNPKETAKVGLKGNITGLGLAGVGTIPHQIQDAADMSAMMEAGFNVSANLTYTGGTSDVAVADEVNGNFAMQTASQGGSLGVKLGPDGIGYSVSQDNARITMSVAELPFPIELGMERSAFNLAMPVTKSDDPQDFAFALALGGFTMSDMIWSIFDPAGQLPRNPATIVVDLAGKAKLLVNYMDPETAAQMGRERPAELQALTLNSLIFDAIGAKLNGSGAVTFDGQGPALVPGLGTPVGTISMTLDGANALLDKLVTMGLVPQDQAMGARMMMGLFAVPGDAPDSLKSKIEMLQDGQILANGQRIR